MGVEVSCCKAGEVKRLREENKKLKKRLEGLQRIIKIKNEETRDSKVEGRNVVENENPITAPQPCICDDFQDDESDEQEVVQKQEYGKKGYNFSVY